jgi:hypothetical protein
MEVLTLVVTSSFVNGVGRSDAPPNSLMDSNVNPEVKTTKGEGAGARSLVRSTSKVERCAGASRWD